MPVSNPVCACEPCGCSVTQQNAVEKDGKLFCSQPCADGHAKGEKCCNSCDCCWVLNNTARNGALPKQAGLLIMHAHHGDLLTKQSKKTNRLDIRDSDGLEVSRGYCSLPRLCCCGWNSISQWTKHGQHTRKRERTGTTTKGACGLMNKEQYLRYLIILAIALGIIVFKHQGDKETPENIQHSEYIRDNKTINLKVL